MRYRPAQLSGVANWAPVHPGGEDWFGFKAVRALPGTRDDVLLVPLPGHSRGHCGVAIRTPSGWLLHCGDAYFHRAEVAPEGGSAPVASARSSRWSTSTRPRASPIRSGCASSRAATATRSG